MGSGFDSDGLLHSWEKQEIDVSSTGFVPGCEHLNPVLDLLSDSDQDLPQRRGLSTPKLKGGKEKKREKRRQI